ncbi:MAG TPA: hypothetical protein VGF93_03005 [Solirubrobacteraceae bacterium]|jgi:hypothetical protein
MWRIGTRTGARAAAIWLGAVATALIGAGSAGAAETVFFATPPKLPTLTGVTLNGRPQPISTTWDLGASPFKITSFGTPFSGWNLTVSGNSAAGSSAVFKEYCPNATCGTHTGPGYITGGLTLQADSLTWSSGAASWTGAAPRPVYQCLAGCHVDNATPVKFVSAGAGVANNTTWTTTGSTTLSLATPASLLKLQTNEVYRLDVVWTLNTGP